MPFLSIHHIQLAMPAGKEALAREFYGKRLGLNEVEKPPVLAKRGGVWFETNGVRIHLGVEDSFIPAKKAHPAFEVENAIGFLKALKTQGVTILEDDNLPEYDRGYIYDPFGNRIEILSPK